MPLRTIHARLRAAAAGVAVILLAAATFGWWTVQRLAQDIEHSVADAARVHSLTNRFTFDVADELRAAEEYLLWRDPRAEQEFVERGRDAHNIQAVLVRLQLGAPARDSASDAELVARIDDELSQLESVYASAHRLADLGDLSAARVVVQRRGGSEGSLRADLSLLSDHQASRMAALGAWVREAAVKRAAFLAAMLLAAIGLVVAMALSLGQSISRPLAVLVSHARALHDGARDAKTSVDGLPGEFQVLAEAMNRATDSLASLASTEAALHQAEKLAAIGTLISGVAHELNNPLQTILLGAEILKETTTSESMRSELVIISEQVMRARTIITDLLTTVRQENASRDTAPLESSLRNLERELGLLAERNGVALKLVIASPLPPVLVDRVGLAQIMTNLVSNGAFAAGAGGTVYVRAERCAAGCEIVVDDSGKGIRTEILPRIFEPFFSTKAVGQGTGLGLSVSRGIVESMRGTLTAQANWGGQSTGARFRIVLPVGTATVARPALASLNAPALQDAQRARQAPAADRNRRMLIVDDEPAIQGVLQRYFARRNWTVDRASDGIEALARIEGRGAMGEPYTIIFCDLRMPTMSGIELHDALVERHPQVLERTVFLTGDSVSEDVREFIARSSCRILNKPLDVTVIESAAEHASRAASEGGFNEKIRVLA